MTHVFTPQTKFPVISQGTLFELFIRKFMLLFVPFIVAIFTPLLFSTLQHSFTAFSPLCHASSLEVSYEKEVCTLRTQQNE